MPQLHWAPNVTKLTCLEWETADVSSKHGGLQNDIKSHVENLTFSALGPVKVWMLLFQSIEHFQCFQELTVDARSTFPLH